MAGFITATMESVLAQEYPNLEHVVADGGSTDGTLEIVRAFATRYPKRIRLLTGKDTGPAEAIQKGLIVARGEIFAYLNADDTFFPDTVSTAVRALQEHPDAVAVYGNAHWIDANGSRLGVYPTEPFDPETLSQTCYICQPACFVRTSILRDEGGLDLSYQVAFDYELWLRLTRKHRFLKIDSVMANSRMYQANKTMRERSKGLREASGALLCHRGYVPFRWAHSYAAYLIDGRDQFFEPLRPTITKYLFALVVGTLLNRKSLFRFWKEWGSVMSLSALIRRWNEYWESVRLGFRAR